VRRIVVDDITVNPADSERCQNAVEIRHFRRRGNGYDHGMSAILKIGNDFLCLFRREVGTRCKDHQRLAVIRDIRTQKVQVRRRDICFCEELRDGIIQRNLIVSGCDVHRRFRTVGHIGNGACDLAFSVEALAAAVAVGRGIRIVDLIVGNVPALVAAYDDDRIVLHRFVGVLFGKGRIRIEVFLFNLDMGGCR